VSRVLRIGGAQMGPIHKADSRQAVVRRMLDLLEEAKARNCDLVVYPELALTTFFPRWYMADQAEIDFFFDREMTGPETRALFDLAREFGIGFCLGYAELAVENGETHRYNTSVLVGKSGEIISKYRKVHLPGHAEHESQQGHHRQGPQQWALEAGAQGHATTSGTLRYARSTATGPRR